jgi:AsmA protein
MKKIFKLLLWLFIIFVVLTAGALLALKLMFPMEKIKAQVQEQVKNKLNREIDFKEVSLSLKGLSISDFALSEKTTFKEGTFVSAKKAKAEIDLRALLHKQIKIESVGLENFVINIIKDKDGKFNFDDLISKGEEEPSSSSEPSSSEKLPIAISAKQIYTKNAIINFNDESAAMKFSINNLDIEINDFDLADNFSVLITCLSKINMPALTLDPVIFKTAAQINLANLEMAKAQAEIKEFSITYDKSSLILSGLIADFSNPQINLTGTLNGIDDALIKHFVQGEITPFSVPVINMILSAKLNLENSTADISQAKASIGNSFIKSRSSVDFSKEEISFSSDTDLSVSLDEVSSIAKETLQAFNLKGAITGKLNAAQNKNLKLKGNLNFKNIGARFLNKNLENTFGTITIKSLEEIYTDKWQGNFDSSPWNLTLAYKKSKNTNIDLSFYMQNFTLDDINFETLFSKENSAKEQENSSQTTEQTTALEGLYNLKADIVIDQIKNNVLTANKFTVKTDIKDFDLSLEKTEGSLNISTVDGEIRDIDKLMSSSKLFRVLFGSVKVVQKAFNFAKLDNGSITNGIIKYSLIDAAYTLKDGVVSIVKSNIDSDLTVVRATGSADLLKDSVDMKIQAQLGKTGSGGFKPIVINVKGPLSNPSYKLDVLSSLTSLVNTGSKGEENKTGSNIVENAGDVVKTIGSLFKKNK